MPEFNSQFANVFIHYYASKASSTCKLFISEPNLTLEEKRGRLFGIVEINIPSRENSHIIAELINALEESYYGEWSEPGDENIATSFENALERVNERFNQMITEKRFYLVGSLNENTIKEKINLAIGVLRGNKLCISYSNDINLYLLHKTKQDYKSIDLKTVNVGEGTKNNKELKLFSNFLEGELNPPDYLFLSNSSFLNFVSLERIQKTVTSLPIHKAAEYFKNSLLQTEGHNFAAIIIKTSSEETESGQIHKSVSSISELTQTESSTEKLLSPSFWSITKSFGNVLKVPFQKFYSATQKKLRERKLAAQQQALPNLKDSGSAINLTKAPMNDLGLKLKKSYRRVLARSPFYGERMQKTKLWFRLKTIYIKSLLSKIPFFSKALIVIVLALIILFFFSTAYFKHAQTASVDNPAYQAIIDQIEQKRAQAESDLIIGDETKAKGEIADAQNILATLPINSQKQKDKYQSVNAEIEAVIAKLRHIINIDEPTLLFDLSSEQNIDLQNIVYAANDILVFDSASNNIYRYDLDTHEQKKFSSNLSDIGKILKVKQIDNQIIAYHDKNGFVQYQNGKYLPFSLTLSANSKIIDFASYNTNFYAADSGNSQIDKFTKANDVYAAGITWLKSPFDMKNIVSMGIDTNIWLLSNDGKIYKFNKGSRSNFEIKNLDPVLEAPTELFTSDSTNYIYVMEPKNSRIVVLDKQGQLVAQYYSAKFDNLKAFEVSEKDKRMFLINGSKIYFINLTHIK